MGSVVPAQSPRLATSAPPGGWLTSDASPGQGAKALSFHQRRGGSFHRRRPGRPPRCPRRSLTLTWRRAGQIHGCWGCTAARTAGLHGDHGRACHQPLQAPAPVEGGQLWRGCAGRRGRAVMEGALWGLALAWQPGLSVSLFSATTGATGMGQAAPLRRHALSPWKAPAAARWPEGRGWRGAGPEAARVSIHCPTPSRCPWEHWGPPGNGEPWRPRPPTARARLSLRGLLCEPLPRPARRPR